jgi:hypothetical protein
VRARTNIPELDLVRIRGFVDSRVPSHANHQVRLEVDVQGTAVTIVERRAPWRPDIGPAWSHFPIAKLKYSPTHQEWTLFWCDHNLRWHRYDRINTAAQVDPLLAEIDKDPTAIFWGCWIVMGCNSIGCPGRPRSINLTTRRSSSVVEQGTHKPLVGGSNPPSATNPLFVHEPVPI